MSRSENNLHSLLSELRKLSQEAPWVEFKCNIQNSDSIGEYISALSNSATLHRKPFGFVVWGIDDSSHAIVGTTFRPSSYKIGNEDLENWLLRLLSPQVGFSFYEVMTDNGLVVLLEIECAKSRPVQFKGQEYIRIGSHKKKLKDHPEQERMLWRLFDDTPWEEMTAAEELDAADALKMLDYPVYFDLLGLALPENRLGILQRLSEDSMISQTDSGKWNITNLGAVLFAKPLSEFRGLQRKSVRVIQYNGHDRTKTLREQEGTRGYASGFEGLIVYINNLLPRNEVMGQALRRDVSMYPELAVRELVANAIIHQDFSVRGAGPMIEIFDDRMEITNPGTPLVESDRFLDYPPRSRNEALASFLRRVGVCEERGSGFDKVVRETETYQLPAPEVVVYEHNTKVILYAHKSLKKMTAQERIRACYLHSCLKAVNREQMSNATLRERFGLGDQDAPIASRIIRDSVEAGFVKPFDVQTAPRYMKYIPYWA